MTEEMRSRLLGMMMARVSRGVFPQREPIGYLYGHEAKEGEEVPDGCIKRTINGKDYVGVVRPDINTVWTDKLAYSHAVLAKNRYYASDFDLYLFSHEVFVESRPENSVSWFLHPVDAVAIRVCSYKANETGWEVRNYREYTEDDGILLCGRDDGIIWTSEDLLTEDGTLYLAASEPIPIYGEPAIESYLESSDGYTLQDVNENNLIPKEDE